MKTATVFFATLFTFVVLDATWLLLVAAPLFTREVGAVLRAQPFLVPAVVLYLVYAGGMVTLVVIPALRERSAWSALWRGAVLGLAAYGTFDLTNFAIISGWTLTTSLADMTWGTVATASACFAGYTAGRLTTRPFDMGP
jgi:uncharacterized membrane protein